MKEKVKKAKMLLIKSSRLVMLPEKNKGAKTKRFFTHCSTLSSFRYLFIQIESVAKIVIL
jgi:hypothetical protein